MSNVCYLARILIFLDFLGGYLVVITCYLVVTARYLVVTGGYCSSIFAWSRRNAVHPYPSAPPIIQVGAHPGPTQLKVEVIQKCCLLHIKFTASVKKNSNQVNDMCFLHFFHSNFSNNTYI